MSRATKGRSFLPSFFTKKRRRAHVRLIATLAKRFLRGFCWPNQLILPCESFSYRVLPLLFWWGGSASGKGCSARPTGGLPHRFFRAGALIWHAVAVRHSVFFREGDTAAPRAPPVPCEGCVGYTAVVRICCPWDVLCVAGTAVACKCCPCSRVSPDAAAHIMRRGVRSGGSIALHATKGRSFLPSFFTKKRRRGRRPVRSGVWARAFSF